MSEIDESTLDVCWEKASQATHKEETNLIYKKNDETNKLSSFNKVPWWRLADGEELVSLVAQRSVDLIENCDLPRPQSNFGNFPPSFWIPEAHDSGSEDHMLEALGHCQTRARKAERLANQACAENEHIKKLFLLQATHLSAYKQWFQLLQLENRNLRTKINDHGNINDQKTIKLCKMSKKVAKRKRKENKFDYVSKLDVAAFAIGFGLIGSGMLLGWTVGWIFPLF